jgi:hypothetical protein
MAELVAVVGGCGGAVDCSYVDVVAWTEVVARTEVVVVDPGWPLLLVLVLLSLPPPLTSLPPGQRGGPGVV